MRSLSRNADSTCGFRNPMGAHQFQNTGMSRCWFQQHATSALTHGEPNSFAPIMESRRIERIPVGNYRRCIVRASQIHYRGHCRRLRLCQRKDGRHDLVHYFCLCQFCFGFVRFVGHNACVGSASPVVASRGYGFVFPRLGRGRYVFTVYHCHVNKSTLFL